MDQTAQTSTDPLAAERARYGDQLDAAVQSVAAQLQAMPAVRKVVLFGSYAAGRRDLLTDLDLLDVMDSDEEFVTRNATLAGVESVLGHSVRQLVSLTDGEGNAIEGDWPVRRSSRLAGSA